MAKYATGGKLDAWIGIVASIIENVTRKTKMPVNLIPHATNPNSNDHEFMRRALSLIKTKMATEPRFPQI